MAKNPPWRGQEWGIDRAECGPAWIPELRARTGRWGLCGRVGVTRRNHPPTHSALRAGPRDWQGSEYRALPVARFNKTWGEGGGNRSRRAEFVRAGPLAFPDTGASPVRSFLNS